MATEIVCPTCGTVSHFEEISRDAVAFCRVCDYPLFWARSVHVANQNNGEGSIGLRRLPGTAGRIALAMLACPSCTEPNPVTVDICIRCGADLHPAPPPPMPVIVAPPPPPPPPPPPKRVIWPWVAATLAAIAIAIILYFAV